MANGAAKRRMDMDVVEADEDESERQLGIKEVLRGMFQLWATGLRIALSVPDCQGISPGPPVLRLAKRPELVQELLAAGFAQVITKFKVSERG